MKYILFVFAIISLSATAQDSSRLNISLSLKQKTYAIAKSYANQYPNIQDSRFIDSLILHIGSNTTPETVSVSVWKAGRFMQYLLQVLGERAGPVFKYVDELVNATTAANGYSGVMQQLNQKINNNTVDKPAAVWLKAQIIEWNQRFTDLLNERISNSTKSGSIDHN